MELPEIEAVSNIVVTGLGGSAIGGDLLRVYTAGRMAVPVIVNRDYVLPEFVGPDTLVFAVSYSGNTEETLSAYEEARLRGASVVAVTTGGRLGELAAVHIAESYRREKDHEQAADAFEALRLSGRGGAQVYISLAKIYEHRFRQLDKALDIARRGMVYCLENLPGNASAYEDLKRRYNRLIIRTGGK